MPTHSFKTRGLTAGSLFKLLFIGNLGSMGVIFIIAGILSLFDLPVFQGQVNSHGVHAHIGTAANSSIPYVTGFVGLLFGIIGAIVASFLSACVSWIFIGFGQWLWTRFRCVEYRLKFRKTETVISHDSTNKSDNTQTPDPQKRL